jgi:hypothetical protein
MLVYNLYIGGYMIYTTIQVTVGTRERLAKLKSCVRGTYDELLSTLLDFVPSGDDEGEYTDEFKASLIRSLSDIKHGRTYSMDEVRERLGIA